MPKNILISGIQPTGKLHIGNYLGALKNFVNLQNSGQYECYFFVADLHSLTEDFVPQEKPRQILDIVLNFLAAGIDPKKATIFIQSQIAEHAELAWIFSAIAPFGDVSRMTQFKDKAQRQKSNINVGLFTYPILQAADILLYDARFVPIGEDQKQHLELARTLARKFNVQFGKIFTEPQAVLTETPRLMGLYNPAKKMSKSIPDSCLFLDDPADIVRAKIKRATTDSGKEIKYDPKIKPAVSNLMEIYRGFSGMTLREIEKKFKGQNYGTFKNALADLLAEKLKDFQERKTHFLKDPASFGKIIAEGNEKARVRAREKMAAVKKVLGLTI